MKKALVHKYRLNVITKNSITIEIRINAYKVVS